MFYLHKITYTHTCCQVWGVILILFSVVDWVSLETGWGVRGTWLHELIWALEEKCMICALRHDFDPGLWPQMSHIRKSERPSGSNDLYIPHHHPSVCLFTHLSKDSSIIIYHHSFTIVIIHPYILILRSYPPIHTYADQKINLFMTPSSHHPSIHLILHSSIHLSFH